MRNCRGDHEDGPLGREMGSTEKLFRPKTSAPIEGARVRLGGPPYQEPGPGRLCRQRDDCTIIVQRHCRLAAKECSMANFIFSSLVLAMSTLPLYAQTSNLHTDRSGYTTGTDGNRTVNTYTDRYGNTTGWVGGKYISTYSDGYGGTTGTIGNKRITTYEDGYGNITGIIGRDRINLYTDPSGTTTGTIGRRRLNCYTDLFRTTTCN